MGERSSSDDRYRSWKERVSFASWSWESSTAAAPIRRVSLSLWYRSGEDTELSERSGRTRVGFSKVHCWSCADTATSTMVAARRECRDAVLWLGSGGGR